MLKQLQAHLLEYPFIKRYARASSNELKQTLEVEACQAALANKCNMTIQDGAGN